MTFRRFLRSMALTAALAAGASPALAGRITAELDRTEGELGDEFALTVSAEGDLDGDFAQPEVEGLVIEAQGHSRRMTISNGVRVSEVSVTYVVRPQQAGEFTIPSIKAVLDGSEAATLPLKLKVHAAGQSSGQAQSSPPAGAPKGQAAVDTGGVFVERECATGTLYVGEQVLCSVRIYHRGNLNGGQRPGMNSADFRRFTVEGESRYQKVVNGQRYAVIELKDIVVPTRAGRLELPPFVLEARILTWSKRGNPLDKFLGQFGGGAFNFDMNFTEEKQVTLKSDATTFDVKPLPEEGRPAGFQGVVGEFQLSASLGKSPVATGDTTTINVKLEGRGLLDTVAEPQLPLKDLGKVYPDKPEYQETISADAGVRSSKTFRYALVPSNAGTYPLARVEVPVFNPKLGAYVVLAAELGELKVEQGDAKEQPLAVGQSANQPTQSAVTEQQSDLLPAHDLTTLNRKQTITNNSLLISTLFVTTPWILSFCVLTYRSRKQRNLSRSDTKRLRAYRDFCAQLKDAGDSLSASGNVDEAVTKAHRAFRELIGVRSGRYGAALTTRDVDELLNRLGAGESLRSETTRLLAAMEQIEFGGRPLTRDEAGALMRDLAGVGQAMETLKAESV